MKKYLDRSLILLLLVFPLLALAGSGTAVGDEFGRDGVLEIFLQSNKRVYTVGESVVLTLTLINHTTEPLIVNKRFDPAQDIRWEVFLEPEGFFTIKPSGARPLTADDYTRLAPDAQIEKAVDLAQIVQEKLKPGGYGVRGFYVNREKPKGGETWTGEIVTNRVSFQIKSGPKV